MIEQRSRDTAPGQMAGAGPGRGPAEPRRRSAQRESRVAAGLAELERWLADQVRQGIAATRQSGPGHWDELGRRMVDAQAPGAAAVLSRFGSILVREDWPARLVADYSLLHLLAVGHRRRAELPAALGDTIRSRVGFSVPREEVLAGPKLRDRWDVLGRRDEEHDRLAARRVWLRGRESGRPALVLSFAPAGHEPDASPQVGTTIKADLAFYPGSCPLRALVAARHDLTDRDAEGESGPSAGQSGPAGSGAPPPGVTVREALAEIGAALAADPWTDSWPIVLADVVPAIVEPILAAPASVEPLWCLADPASAEALPLRPRASAPWRLIAVSGGRPVTVAAEWTPGGPSGGLSPLCTWDEEGRAVVL